MKRFVTYLYAYEKGKKTKNTGFIRVDIREHFVNMEICIRKFNMEMQEASVMCSPTEGKVYALAVRRGLHGVELGTINIQGGQGNLRLQLLAKNLQESEFSIQDVVGIGICFSNQGYLASCWTDAYTEAVGNGAFSVQKKERVSVEESSKLVKTDLSVKEVDKEKNNDENFSLKETCDAQVNKFTTCMGDRDGTLEQQNTVGNISPIEEGVSSVSNSKIEGSKMEWKEAIIYKKMDLSQLKEIPSQNLHYERNAFLIHGFWNYGYLVLKTEVENGKKEMALGVPGVYERQEAAMAMVFGFPKFETFPQEVEEMSVLEQLEFSKEEMKKIQQPKENSFGCWFVELNTNL